MKNKNHEKIWKKIKPAIDSVQSFMELMRLNANNTEDWARLANLERQFLRGMIYAESEKYVNEKKPLITKEGWHFVIDGPAIEECLKKIIIDNIKKNKKADPDMRIPQDLEIHEEAESWARLGLYPLIHEAAKKSYKKGIPNCMNELAKLCKDKSLNFDAPAKQFIKKIFKGIFK
jgi:hypothetical protein|tara:strand:- start:553 stop:1077 length:525 start_codon:yes stop_codon:yes gene_type:complete